MIREIINFISQTLWLTGVFVCYSISDILLVGYMIISSIIYLYYSYNKK